MSSSSPPLFSSIDDLRVWLAADLKRYFEYRLRGLGHTPEMFQYMIADWLQGSRPEWAARKKTVLGFRGCSKTTMLRWFVEWRWMRKPDTQIIVHSSTDALAAEFTKSLLDTIRNDDLFAQHRPRPPVGTLQFTLDNITIEKGHSIRCAGVNTSVTGQRAHLYIFDDPEPDTQPEAMYHRILAAFQEAENVLHPQDFQFRRPPHNGVVPVPELTQYIVSGQPHWTGTAYLPPAPDPMTGEEKSHPLRDSLFLRIPALRTLSDGTEVSMMPTRFRTKELLRIRDQHIMTPSRWRLQMMIDASPVEGEGAVVPVTKLNRLHHDPVKLTNLSLVVDPADSDRGCEWGLACGGTYGNTIHIVDMLGYRGQIYSEEAGILAGEEIWSRIFEYANFMGVRKIYLEKNLRAARTAAVRTMRKMNVRGQVFEYSAAANKLKRIVETLDHPANSGMLTFEEHALDDPENFRQLAELRYTSLPVPCDRLDALAGLVSTFLELPQLMSAKKRATKISPPYADKRIPTFASIRKESPFIRLKKAGGLSTSGAPGVRPRRV